MARLPQASRIAALEPAQQYAAAELFRGTMMSHSVIVRRDDRPGRSQAISFSGDAWLDYVPVRVPDTLCVQERLPPGAAAVLINRAHTYTDIYLPIDAREKRLVDAIDGERSIGEIAGDEQRDVCRALFERLWWHDQVVFDGSRRNGEMSMQQFVVLTLQLSIVCIVFSLGLMSTMADLLFLWRRPGLLLRSLVAMLVVMPVVAVGLTAVAGRAEYLRDRPDRDGDLPDAAAPAEKGSQGWRASAVCRLAVGDAGPAGDRDDPLVGGAAGCLLPQAADHAGVSHRPARVHLCASAARCRHRGPGVDDRRRAPGAARVPARDAAARDWIPAAAVRHLAGYLGRHRGRHTWSWSSPSWRSGSWSAACWAVPTRDRQRCSDCPPPAGIRRSRCRSRPRTSRTNGSGRPCCFTCSSGWCW